MNTLLKIQTSLSGDKGLSSQLAERFAADWLRSNPHGRVVTRDLAAQPVPHLTAERFQAFAMHPEARTADQQAAVEYSDALVAELHDAEVIVLAVPMYNFSVPSTLRAYFDHIARAGVTFRYTANGPEGLLKGKKVYVLITRGGVYPSAVDTQTPYLRQFLGFVGLTDVEVIHVEGLAVSDEARQRSIVSARNAIASLLPVAGSAHPGAGMAA